jgi:hypothetical protein
MNEKLKQLALEAGLIFPVPPATSEPLPHQVRAMEQYATLVVRETVKECLRVIRQEWYDENNTEPEQDARSIAIHVGKKIGINSVLESVGKNFNVRLNE